MGCLPLLQGIFPTQGLNQSLLHCKQILYYLSHQGSPYSIVVYYKILSVVLCACMLSRFSPVRLCYPMDHSLPGFSRQEYWSGLLCPPPRDLPCPWIELAFLLCLCLGSQILYCQHHLESLVVPCAIQEILVAYQFCVQ